MFTTSSDNAADKLYKKQGKCGKKSSQIAEQKPNQFLQQTDKQLEYYVALKRCAG